MGRFKASYIPLEKFLLKSLLFNILHCSFGNLNTNDRIVACLSSWADELNARCDRVRHLIGAKHWLSDGRQKEHILAEFLRRHLPEKFHVDSGFICPPDPEIPTSGELDILVTDVSRDVPWFSEGQLRITPPAAVLAQIHVKTTFAKKEFVDVIQSIAEACSSLEQGGRISHVWAGGFFFVDGQQLKLAELLSEWTRDAFKSIKTMPQNSYFPDCIAVLDGPVLLFTKPSQGPVQVKAFASHRFAAAVFLANLVDHIQTETNGEHFISPLSQLVVRLGLPHLFSTELTLTD